ncbi:NHL repeat-containing protein [Silvimonas amylolytica]|uniref:NHL repeat-containing protein n=1 Tax=Silvimonas amylolytica TaxID=449663 RepID=A0ABQ2PSD7_9NEIS|nr:NHL repeat-containing protein [Silvimonas amylolytica]GGP27892.1 hypothetical protein GCM10010971_37110 [Silvimonas amylolytica]
MGLFERRCVIVVTVVLPVLLAACMSGGDDPASVATLAVTPAPDSNPTPTPTASPLPVIGGVLHGLQALTALQLQNNGADTLVLTANGAFSFATPGRVYAVTVATQPSGFQWCSVANGVGSTLFSLNTVDVSCASAVGFVSTIAGSANTPGRQDAQGSTARFYYPLGLAVDHAGTVYIADFYNQQIRKMTADGTVSTLAGSGAYGHTDAQGTNASFFFPEGVAVDAAGNVYVVDTDNYVIRKIAPDGTVSTLAGYPGTQGSSDGQGAGASFNLPGGIAVDSNGVVYVADTENHEIRKVLADGTVSTLAGSTAPGAADGTGAAASFNEPAAVAVDQNGNVFVADASNNEIRKITPAGTVSTIAGSTTAGSADGTGSAAAFNSPHGIAVDAYGNLYVADLNNRSIRKISPGGVVSTLANANGSPGVADGKGAAATFEFPWGIATDTAGNLYVTDYAASTLRKITPAQP